MDPVKKSVLAPYVDEISDDDLQDVALLTSAEAAEVWEANFDGKAKGLYDLPNDSWVVRGPWSVIGSWIDAYNGLADPAEVEDIIVKASNWSIDEPLLFVQNSRQVVALELRGFLKCWQELLAAFDDGPILMALRGDGATALRFVPLGQVMLTTKNDDAKG